MPMIWLADIPRLTGPIAAPGVIIAGVISPAVTGPAARSNPKIAAARARTICGFPIFTQCAAIVCTPAPYEADNRKDGEEGGKRRVCQQKNPPLTTEGFTPAAPATRPTCQHRWPVPWLCVPRSLWVCPYGSAIKLHYALQPKTVHQIRSRMSRKLNRKVPHVDLLEILTPTSKRSLANRPRSSNRRARPGSGARHRSPQTLA